MMERSPSAWVGRAHGASCGVGVLLVMLTVVTVCMTTASQADAQPRWARLSFAGGDAATTMTVTWNTDAAELPSRVEYGATNQYGQFVESTDAPIAGPGGLGYVHSVTLTGLEPNTNYHYRAGGAAGYTQDATFTTTPADGCAPWSFIALGDGRSDDSSGANPKYANILGEAVDERPRFIVDTGDLVRDGSSVSQWVDWLTKSAAPNAVMPHLASLGNHDTDSVEGDGALFNQIFAFPRNPTSNTEDYYAFTAGNAVFVAISTATHNDDGFAAQAAWLDQVLTQHADKTWRFVFLHHPIYTSHAKYLGMEFNHPPNEQGQNAALVPIFDKHHVDIVFAGHNHYYERFLPLVGGGGADEGNLAGSFEAGTVYMTTGGAGAFTYDDFDVFGVSIDLIGFVCSNFTKATGSAICDGRHHYVRLDIDNHQLTVTTTSTTEQNLGTATPELIETFVITKANPASCTPPDPEPDGAELADTTADTQGGDTAVADTSSGPDTTPDAAVAEPVANDTATATADTQVVLDTAGNDTQTPPTANNTSSDGCGCGLLTSPPRLRFPAAIIAIFTLVGLVLVSLVGVARRR